MNLNGKMKLLQKALGKSGFPVKVNVQQFFSSEQERMINQYHVMIKVDYFSKKYDKWLTKDEEILKTCSMPDVIFCLLDIYKAVKENENI